MSRHTLDGEDVVEPLQSGNSKAQKIVVAVVMVVFLIGIGMYAYAKFAPDDEQAESPETHGIAGKVSSSDNGRKFSFSESVPEPRKKISHVKIEKEEKEEKEEKQDPPAPVPVRVSGIKPIIVPHVDKSRSSLSIKSRESSIEDIDKTTKEAIDRLKASQESKSGFGGGTAKAESGLADKLISTETASASASVLSNRDFLMAKGTFVNCVLNTRINSTVAGMTKCTLTNDIYSDNGNVLLLERGSTVTGEYQEGIAQGMARIFILWNRVKTPSGVVVNLDSPATDALGASGVEGHVDTHFWQRFGGAMMLSLVDDTAAYLTRNAEGGNALQSTSDSSQDMAAEALKATINIPATLSKNQGERVGIFVARDIDFSDVYGLEVTGYELL